MSTISERVRSAEQADQSSAAHGRLSIELSAYRAAIEASANAMVITRAVAPDFIIEYVNPAFESVTGFAAS